MTRILGSSELEAVCGGLSFRTRIRAFSEANRRWTEIVNAGGPDAARSPAALRLDRIMRRIDEYPPVYRKTRS